MNGKLKTISYRKLYLFLLLFIYINKINKTTIENNGKKQQQQQ